jgi:hypothetical protein
MRRTVIFAFIFLNALISYGQKGHLEPATFDVGGGMEIYYKNLNTLLYDGMTDRPYARFTAIPSFLKEYAFSIEKEKKEYFIISISLSESYWRYCLRAEKKENVKFITHKTKIDKKFYTQIGVLFQILAEQTKRHEIADHTIDGEKYYFITSDNKGKIKIGETRGIGNLIDVCDNLYSIGTGNNDLINETKGEVDNLINELKK